MQNVTVEKTRVARINVGDLVRLGNEIQGYRFAKVTMARLQNSHMYRVEFEGDAIRWTVGVTKYFDVVKTEGVN